MNCTFNEDKSQATVDHGNGNVVKYDRYVDVYFHSETLMKVIQELNTARLTRQWGENPMKVRIHYGDVKTGQDWLEENDVMGYIGASQGPLKVPILLSGLKAEGDGAILDHCIVKLCHVGKGGGRLLYEHPTYRLGEFKIRPAVPADVNGDKSYKFAVDHDGKVQACFKTLLRAQKYVKQF